MNITTDGIRASHVNVGTSIPEDELGWPAGYGRVMRMPQLHMEVDTRSEVTPYGGLALVAEFFRRFKVARSQTKEAKVGGDRPGWTHKRGVRGTEGRR